jgi:hypothetical protein
MQMSRRCSGPRRDGPTSGVDDPVLTFWRVPRIRRGREIDRCALTQRAPKRTPQPSPHPESETPSSPCPRRGQPRESADLARGLEPFDGLIETTHVQPCAPDVLSATAVDLREVLGRVCCLVVVGEVRSRAKRVEGSRRFDRGVSLKKCDELLTNEARHRANDAGTGRLLPSRR